MFIKMKPEYGGGKKYQISTVMKQKFERKF